MHKFVCGLVESVCYKTRLFWDFRYLKITWNLSVKSKLKCWRLSPKLPKNTRHPIWKIHINEAIAMKCQKQSCGCSLKKNTLKIFAKFTRKPFGWSLFLILDNRDSSVGVLLWILQNFRNTYFVEHRGTVASETLHN